MVNPGSKGATGNGNSVNRSGSFTPCVRGQEAGAILERSDQVMSALGSMRERYEEGWYTVFAMERIDQATHRLLRLEMTSHDLWGSGALNRHEFFDFNAPISIEPPSATPSPPASLRIFAPFAGRG